jgi:hypothetical protein
MNPQVVKVKAQEAESYTLHTTLQEERLYCYNLGYKMPWLLKSPSQDQTGT